MYYDFSENLRTLRKERKMTQDMLAEKLNTHKNTISRWETCTSYPTLDMIYDIARILEVDVTLLLKENKNILK